MAEVWILIILFADHPAHIFGDIFYSKQHCAEIGEVLVIATKDRANYLNPPYVCVKRG